ncbi:hypothetical protein H4R24_003798 [Coemansia sp. RSA 988]|nr:hypothetical protein H4R24_003798 [Coemansia sp. RSA 988]
METDVTSRICHLPTCHPVSKTKFMSENEVSGTKKKPQIANPMFRNVVSYNHTHALGELVRISATFSRPEIYQDRQLLGRIFYRNWNQHKNSVYFRRLYELRRTLRILLDNARVQELFEQLIAAFYDLATVRSARKVTMWKSLPCQHFATAIAGRFAFAARLASKLQAVCWNTYVQFAAQTAQTLFMPLALIVQGLTARLFVIADVWHQDLTVIYKLLLEWLPYLPTCPDGLTGKTQVIAAQLVDVDFLKIPLPFETPAVRENIAKAAVNPALNVQNIDGMAELVITSNTTKRPVDDLEADMEVESTPKKKKKKKMRARQLVLDPFAGDDIGGKICIAYLIMP